MRWLLSGLFLLIGNSYANEIATASRDYVETLGGCGFDHGYVCRSQQESDFLGVEADKIMVPGIYMKAFDVALKAFQSAADIKPEQRELKHYKIGFSENAEQYIVHFQGLLMPEVKDGEVTGMTRGIYGKTTRYWINKKTLSVDKRLFYK
jgi:hypothetical protein